MVFAIVAMLFILIAWKWGDWRNWRTYYPTIAFWIIGNYLADTLTYTKPLWLFDSPGLNNTLIDLFWKYAIYPSVLMVYLYRYPKSGTSAKLIHIGVWIVAFSILELFLSSFGYMWYYNGWNFWCSVAFNCLMFPLLRLHYINIPLAWLAAILIGVSMIIFFRIPVLTLR